MKKVYLIVLFEKLWYAWFSI